MRTQKKEFASFFSSGSSLLFLSFFQFLPLDVAAKGSKRRSLLPGAELACGPVVVQTQPPHSLRPVRLVIGVLIVRTVSFMTGQRVWFRFQCSRCASSGFLNVCTGGSAATQGANAQAYDLGQELACGPVVVQTQPPHSLRPVRLVIGVLIVRMVSFMTGQRVRFRFQCSRCVSSGFLNVCTGGQPQPRKVT